MDCEIAPLGVGYPIPAKRNLGFAAIGFDIAPQRGHFEWLTRNQHGHCAMLDPGGDRFPARVPDPAHDFVWQRGGGYVDFTDRQGQESIADRAADNARLLILAVENCEELRGFAADQPTAIAENFAASH